MVSPQAKRQAVRYLADDHQLSQRRACQLVGISRSTARYQPCGRSDDDMVEAVRDFAYRFPQHGYRLITARMRREGYNVNHKRVERIWRQEGLQLPRRKTAKRRFGVSQGDMKQRAQYPNHVWSYDFTESRTTRGQRVRVLAVMDEYTRECLMIYAATSIGSKRVINLLSWLFATRGVPQHIRSDNGPEFIAHQVQQWLADQGSQTLYITPGSPWENPFIERFFETMKRENLNRYLFDRVAEAQMILDTFMEDYNRFRPHSSLDDLTPVEFRQQHHQQQILTPTGT